MFSQPHANISKNISFCTLEINHLMFRIKFRPSGHQNFKKIFKNFSRSPVSAIAKRCENIAKSTFEFFDFILKQIYLI